MIELPGLPHWALRVEIDEVYVSPSETMRAVCITAVDGWEEDKATAYFDAAQTMGVAAALVDQVKGLDPTYPIMSELLQWCLVLELARGGGPIERAGTVVSQALVHAAVELRRMSEETNGDGD